MLVLIIVLDDQVHLKLVLTVNSTAKAAARRGFFEQEDY